MAALLALAFTDANKEQMVANDELSVVLERICQRCEAQASESDLNFMVIASLRRTKGDVAYLLWSLGLAEDSDLDSQIDAGGDVASHVMISCHEEQIGLAQQLYQRLQQAGYRTWNDADTCSVLSSETGSQMPASHCPGERMRVLKDEELRSSIFISHSRRDAAAINVAYCIIYALRYAHSADGKPICPATYIPGGKTRLWLWVDKEQMVESGGSDWVEILTKAQKQACTNWSVLCFLPSTSTSAVSRMHADLPFAHTGFSWAMRM